MDINTLTSLQSVGKLILKGFSTRGQCETLYVSIKYR